MKLTLPLPPNLANKSWGHWSRKKRARDSYMLSCIGADVGKRPPKPYGKARITVTLYVWSLMDRDNLMARLKWSIDWLVEREIITDDSPQYLEWSGLPRQVVDRKNMRVDIEIEDIQEGRERV